MRLGPSGGPGAGLPFQYGVGAAVGGRGSQHNTGSQHRIPAPDPSARLVPRKDLDARLGYQHGEGSLQQRGVPVLYWIPVQGPSPMPVGLVLSCFGPAGVTWDGPPCRGPLTLSLPSRSPQVDPPVAERG